LETSTGTEIGSQLTGYLLSKCSYIREANAEEEEEEEEEEGEEEENEEEEKEGEEEEEN